MKTNGFKSDLKIESFSGDCGKLIEKICDQMVFIDNLQKAEINEIMRSELKARKILQSKGTYKKRPSPTKRFLSNYSSDENHTRSAIRDELCLGDRIELLILVFWQLNNYDKVSGVTFLALIRSYLNEHIREENH